MLRDVWEIESRKCEKKQIPKIPRQDAPPLPSICSMADGQNGAHNVLFWRTTDLHVRCDAIHRMQNHL